MKNAREIALHILYDIEYNGAYSNIALKNTFLKNNDLSNLDKAFITRLVYGVVSMKLNLEYIISKNSKIRLKKISKHIMLILKMGIYQIKCMDKVPESAAVNESVKLAKRYGHGASSGFVNGVLRNILKTDIEYPKDKIERLSVELSYPIDLCKKWCDDFGYDFTKELLCIMNEEAMTTLRVNTLKTTKKELCDEFLELTPSEIYENAVLVSGIDVSNSKMYKKGYVYPQDISAMMASVVLNPKKNERVLDLCSAPGGKSTHMAELMENEGEIVSVDIHEHKMSLIENNSKRLGIDIIKTKCMDSTVFLKDFENSFDKVLADVPCTGLGIISKKPDIKWKADEMSEIIKVSEKILTNALRYVKIGGEILFSTCTLNREENELMLNKILKEHKNFEPVDITMDLPEVLRKDTAKSGYVTFYPNVDGIDGFFIAKLKRCSL